jgi:hypothetical protein
MQIKLTLKGTKPLVWRRVLVRDQFNLGQLHDLIQMVMGWTGAFDHEFLVGDTHYGFPDPSADLFWGAPLRNEQWTRLSQIATPGLRFHYYYDLLEPWDHEILVEAIQTGNEPLVQPRCLAGRQPCPPEESGGPRHYQHLRNVLADPGHREYAGAWEQWGQEIATSRFDLAATNRRLAQAYAQPLDKGNP